MLLCGHDLCRKCCLALQKQAASKKHATGRFFCPECRAEIVLDERGIDALPRNFRLQSLCDRIRKLNRSNSMDLPDMEDPYSTLSVSYMRRKGSVMSHMAALVEKIKELERFIKSLEEKCETVEKNCTKLKATISKECDSLMSLLEQKRKVMITDIDKSKNDLTTQLRRQVVVYTKALEEAKRSENKVKGAMESMKQKEFIKNTKSLEDTLDSTADGLPALTPSVSDKFVISVDFKTLKDEMQKLRIDVKDKLRTDEHEDKKQGNSVHACEVTQQTSKSSKDGASRSANRKSRKERDQGKRKSSLSTSEVTPKDQATPQEPLQYETAT
ncbi:tripartite motif-containing protein 55-like [Ptychodera flava]|uniref:tripartite motif-containing protein 55-like n=1 Tax=Ptychodera flava TaxID=63121 RepID=UPI003969D5D9